MSTRVSSCVIYFEKRLWFLFLCYDEVIRQSKISISGYVCRRCPNQQVYYKADDPHPFCRVECEARTMCGEVQVPEEHLDVRFVINIYRV